MRRDGVGGPGLGTGQRTGIVAFRVIAPNRAQSPLQRHCRAAHDFGQFSVVQLVADQGDRSRDIGSRDIGTVQHVQGSPVCRRGQFFIALGLVLHESLESGETISRLGAQFLLAQYAARTSPSHRERHIGICLMLGIPACCFPERAPHIGSDIRQGLAGEDGTGSGGRGRLRGPVHLVQGREAADLLVANGVLQRLERRVGGIQPVLQRLDPARHLGGGAFPISRNSV